jgi:hypothetical protein
MRPAIEGTNVLMYIEDMHMTQFDKFEDSTSAETLRELV